MKTMLHASVIVVCLTLLMTAGNGHAQSLNSCMTTKGEDAITLCQRILDNGRDDVEAYYQLTSQLYQLGRTDEALVTLEKGLARHNGNTLLTTLQTTLLADTEEQAALRASAKRNQAAMNRGQLKLTCLTQTSSEGVEACRGYLAKTNVDGDRIRNRMNDILAAIAPKIPDAKTAVARVEAIQPTTISSVTPEPLPEQQAPSTPVSTPTQPIVETQATDATQIAMRELIREVQSQLATLGFDVGIPDGIAGPKTSAAVKDFYRLTQRTNSDRLDDQTLTDVRAAVVKLNTAENLLQRSREAESNQQYETALDLLATAEKSSPLFSAPNGYKQNLISLADQQSGGNRGNSNTITAPEQPSVQVAAQGNQLDQLLSEIQSISATLNLRRANNRRQTQAMRDEVDNLFR